MAYLIIPDKSEFRRVNDNTDIAIRYWQENAAYEELVIMPCHGDCEVFDWFIFGENDETDWEMSDEAAPDGFSTLAECLASVRAFLTFFPRGEAQENALRLIQEFEDANNAG